MIPKHFEIGFSNQVKIAFTLWLSSSEGCKNDRDHGTMDQLYTFTKRVPFLKPWLWNRRSLPGRKWRQSRPKWQPKFIQEPHSSRTLQSNNTWNSCSYKWRSSGKNHLKLWLFSEKFSKIDSEFKPRPAQYLKLEVRIFLWVTFF